MIPFPNRLEQLKEALQPLLKGRMIFLLNPKDTKILEAIIAWTVMPKQDVSRILVEENATMHDLWSAVEVNEFLYATCLGCTVQQALPRLNQLRELNLIYPDGTVAEMAMSIINVYIATSVGELQQKRRKTEDG